ncbi:MAG TPA: (deoxy)nucleoside triphosphate pyrophosphohydrolase [Verrucomicrobiae bacterium]|jgi:8-oxo-dGTP diphosphatase|nr:(deoxy)nucleoside triphosphate pyrophosphohydrolase [Verrucomicrobiae bacterium]
MKLVVAALIVRDSQVLICQRTKNQAMPLRWEFPGGKVEPGETPVEAMRRELEEELGIRARIGPQIAAVQHTYRNGTSVDLRFYLVQRFDGEIVNRIFHEVRWVNPKDFPTYDFLEADVELVKNIANGTLELTGPDFTDQPSPR